MPSQREQPTYQELVAFVFRAARRNTGYKTVKREALELCQRINPGGLTETAKRTAFAAFAFKVGADPNWYNKTFQAKVATRGGHFRVDTFTVIGLRPDLRYGERAVQVANSKGEITWLSISRVRDHIGQSTDVLSRREPPILRRPRRAIQR